MTNSRDNILQYISPTRAGVMGAIRNAFPPAHDDSFDDLLRQLDQHQIREEEPEEEQIFTSIRAQQNR